MIQFLWSLSLWRSEWVELIFSSIRSFSQKVISIFLVRVYLISVVMNFLFLFFLLILVFILLISLHWVVSLSGRWLLLVMMRRWLFLMVVMLLSSRFSLLFFLLNMLLWLWLWLISGLCLVLHFAASLSSCLVSTTSCLSWFSWLLLLLWRCFLNFLISCSLLFEDKGFGSLLQSICIFSNSWLILLLLWLFFLLLCSTFFSLFFIFLFFLQVSLLSLFSCNFSGFSLLLYCF